MRFNGFNETQRRSKRLKGFKGFKEVQRIPRRPERSRVRRVGYEAWRSSGSSMVLLKCHTVTKKHTKWRRSKLGCCRDATLFFCGTTVCVTAAQQDTISSVKKD